MKIAVASEHRGFKSKGQILACVRELKHEGLDFGPCNDEVCDYPDYAVKVALAVSRGEIDRGILIGGTGIGMNIVANKFKGIRAALCDDELSARISRSHHDANILCLSVNLLGAVNQLDERLASDMIRIWLDTPFEGGRYARRNEKIALIEQSCRGTNKPSDS
jgi:ribose 5-phosphate isomerase B